MENFKRLFPWLVCAILAVCVIVLFEQTNALESQIAANCSQFQDRISDMQNEIDNIYFNVDSSLKKQASILSDAEVNYGKLDASTNKAELLFNIVPKTVTEDMRVFITVGDERSELLKSGDSFSGKIPVDIFLSEDCYPLISIESEGDVRTEYLDTNNLVSLWVEFLPYIQGSYTVDGTEIHNGKVHLGTAYDITFDSKNCIYMDEFYLVTEKNGKETERIDITADVKASHTYSQGSYSLTIEKTCNVTENDNICVYIVSVDSLGYTYKAPVFYWEELETNGNSAVAPADNYVQQIYDPDYDLVYPTEEKYR